MCLDLYEHFVLYRRKETLEKEREQIKIFRLPIITFLMLAFTIGNVVFYASFEDMYRIMTRQTELFLFSVFLIGIPLCFVIFEMTFLITESFNKGLRGEKRIDLLVFVLGTALELSGILFLTDGVTWYFTGERADVIPYYPVNIDTLPTVVTFLCLSILGYIILEYIPMTKMAPMVAILAMSAMYIGDIVLMILTIQIQPSYEVAPTVFFQYIYILPACWIMITARVIIEKIYEWKIVMAQRPVLDQEGIGTALEEALNTPLSWPIIAVLMMIPLFAAVALILGAFGQPSDAITRAFTETIGWTFSK